MRGEPMTSRPIALRYTDEGYAGDVRALMAASKPARSSNPPSSLTYSWSG